MFLNDEHKTKFEDLCKKANIKNDVERKCVMYIIAGGSGLYSKADKLYDFQKNEFIFDIKENEDGKKEILWKASLSSSQEKLMLLAFSLYSGRDNVGVVELFNTLDSNNRILALNVISARYNQ